MAKENRPLEDVLDDFCETVDEEGTSVGDLVHSFEDRSLGAVLVVLSGILIIPFVGGIPGVPDVVATLILLFIFHSWFGSGGIWIPDFLEKKEIEREKLSGAVDKARPWAKRIDRLLKTRFKMFVNNAAARTLISVICALLALSIYILGFVPFAMLPAAIAIMAFGLALLGRDGLLALIGYVFVAGTVYMLWRVWGMVF
ncbi:exopolysaccharide biosynthesis protein [Roseobacter sp. HKCCA0434]|uniref:exopolysaccharide biosynthesis protein n=1 Tax=Roseobacter sp. HKCCA0434 TaxID=3079297 RepID=UPI002905F102|nr:exopolysaccharide biosynthesis protein [Roseobacter sp. HKCCA0434]